MIENFVKEYTKLIATYPNKISTKMRYFDNNTAELIINADKIDTGKLIGKNGKMISSIKVFIAGVKDNNLNYKISVRAIDETKI